MSLHTASPFRRIIVAAFALSAMLTAAPSGSQFVAPPPHPIRYPYTPTGCPSITRLGVDFLDDDVTEAPERYDTRKGTMREEGVASFHLYALADDPRYFRQVTLERRYIRIRITAARGSPPVRGKAWYREIAGDRSWVLVLTRRTREDRKAIVTFSYRCPNPRRIYKREFELDIPGTESGSAS